MIEQQSVAVKFLAFFTESKVGKTGLTVTVDVRGHDGAEIVTAASATEVGDGLYSYTLSGGSTANAGAYVAIFKTATDTVDQQHIPSLWCIGVAGVEHLDADVSDAASSADPLLNPVPGSYPSGTAGNALGRIASGQITTVSPVAQNGDIEIVRGDDYDAADGRAFDWTGTGWPALTSGTVAVSIGASSFTGSVVTPTGDAKTVRLELSAEQTAGLKRGRFVLHVRATAGGDTFTLVTAKATVK